MTAGPDDRLRSWLTSRLAESQHFEVKRELRLGNRKDKIEVLKDLTGMGNGGGGVVVFGIAESKTREGESVANQIVELTDPVLPEALRDIVDSNVRPTLRVKWTRVEQGAGGYVLIADVERSPLGPYMVNGHNEYRYWRRVGTDVRLMDERMVHDLYAEAERWQRDRSSQWEELKLPLVAPRTPWPWLTTSGLPEFTAGDPFDPAQRDRATLRYQADDAGHAQLARLRPLSNRLTVWADGFASEAVADPAARPLLGDDDQARMRIHRDGSIGIGLMLTTPRRLDAVRALNAQLVYCAQLWHATGVSAVDLRIELTGFGTRRTNVSQPNFPQPPGRSGAPTPRIVLSELARVEDLAAASSRHRLLRLFADRLANLYGESTQRIGFEFGPLCTADRQVPAIAAPGYLTYTDWPDYPPAPIAPNGAIRQPHSSEIIAWWRDGAVLTTSGDIAAVLEFPILDGLPADFIPSDVDFSEDVRYADWDRQDWIPDIKPPPCSGKWSSEPIESILTQC